MHMNVLDNNNFCGHQWRVHAHKAMGQTHPIYIYIYIYVYIYMYIYIYVHLNIFGPLELLLGSVTILIFGIHGGMDIQLEVFFDARGRVARF